MYLLLPLLSTLSAGDVPRLFVKHPQPPSGTGTSPGHREQGTKTFFAASPLLVSGSSKQKRTKVVYVLRSNMHVIYVPNTVLVHTIVY